MYPKVPLWLPILNPSVCFDPQTGEIIELRFDTVVPSVGSCTLNIVGHDDVVQALKNLHANNVNEIAKGFVQVETLYATQTSALCVGTLDYAIKHLETHAVRCPLNNFDAEKEITRLQRFI